MIPMTSLPPVQAQGTPQNQGTPGSCEVWSAGYAMGSYTANVTNQKPISDIANTVSPGFLYPWVLNEQQQCCGGGTLATNTLEYLVLNTAPSLAQVPYSPDCACLEMVDINQTFQTDLSIGSWCSLRSNNDFETTLSDVKGYVSESRVVQTTILVPWEFGSYTGGVFDVASTCPTPAPTPPPTCQQHGSIACVFSAKTDSSCAQHGIAIIGYDDTMVGPNGQAGALLIMNSFGPGWGESGFMWMSYRTFQGIYQGGTLAFPPITKGPGPVIIWQSVEEVPGEPSATRLVIEADLGEPLSGLTVRVTAPTGQRATQNHLGAFRHGFFYLTRSDGKQFDPGKYNIEILESGTNVLRIGTLLDLDTDPQSQLPSGPFPSSMTGTNGQPVTVEQ